MPRSPLRCPQACPCPLVPRTPVPSPPARVLPGSSAGAPALAAPGALPGVGGCRAAVLCHRLSVRPLSPPLLESCGRLLAEPPQGPAGLLLAERPGAAASWWPHGGARGAGVAGGAVAGTAGARPLNVASVKFVSSVLGGGVGDGCLFVFLNKCTKERPGLLSRGSGRGGRQGRSDPRGGECSGAWDRRRWWGGAAQRVLGDRDRRPSGQPGCSLRPLAFRQQRRQRSGSASAPRHPLALAAPAGGTAAGAAAGPVPKRAWEPGAAMAGGYF